MNHGGYYFVQTIFYFLHFHNLTLKISKSKRHCWPLITYSTRHRRLQTNTRRVGFCRIQNMNINMYKDINMIIAGVVHSW